MKKLTSAILAVAMALSILGVMAVCVFQKMAYGGASPEIVFSGDELAVSTSADDAALLAGVTATDAEDGDVTDSLVCRVDPACARTARCRSPTRPSIPTAT